MRLWPVAALLVAACSGTSSDFRKPDDGASSTPNDVNTDVVDGGNSSSDNGNLPPEFVSITVNPTSAQVGDTLTCTATATDPNGDTPVLAYTWSTGFSGDTYTVQQGVAAGDIITCTATATDDDMASTSSTATASVLNTPPGIPTISMSPNVPVTTDDLVCAVDVDATDVNGDALTYSFTWLVDGVWSGVTGSTVPASQTTGDQTWTCGAIANDGLDAGSPAFTSVTICPNDPECDGFIRAPNGITVLCPDVPVGTTGEVDGVIYTRRDRSLLDSMSSFGPFSPSCTSGVTDMSYLLYSSGPSSQDDISTWDVSAVTDMSYMFAETYYLISQDITAWDVSSVTDMTGMFQGAAFNQPIGVWNVSNVTNTSWMFSWNDYFNQPLNGWDVGSVTNMRGMFQEATVFNKNISSWDVSNVTTMREMFKGASWFNKAIGGWNVGNVTDMNAMFEQASAFNQPIGSWNVSNVTTMQFMFSQAISFNRDISNWDVENVEWMTSMFYEALSFNQNLSSWCVWNVGYYNRHFFAEGAQSWWLPQPVWGTCPP